MTDEEIDRLVKIHIELFKDDKYVLKCLESDLDYLDFNIDKDKSKKE